MNNTLFRALGRIGWKAGAPAELMARCALVAGLFLCILGARLWMIRSHGVNVPLWDDWLFPISVFPALDEGRFSLWDWIAPHNEHRILFTRLFSVAVYWLNGRMYEPLIQMALNTGLAASAWCLIFVMVSHRRPLTESMAILLVVLALTVLPFTWENILSAFQSQFYFLIGFAALGCWLVLHRKVFSFGWWLGLGACLAAFFSQAGGLLVWFAISATWMVGAAAERKLDRTTGIVILSFLAVGLGLLVFGVPPHSGGEKQTIVGFTKMFFGILAWPFNEQAWMAPVMWWPLGSLVGRCLYLGKTPSAGQNFLIALGGWVMLNAAVTAWGRPNPDPYSVTSRHLDIFCLSIPLNLAAFFDLRPLVKSPGKARLMTFGMSGWLVLFSVGAVGFLFRDSLPTLTVYRGFWKAQEQALHQFLRSGNRSCLMVEEAHFMGLEDHLADSLSLPGVRRSLPSSVRLSLPYQVEQKDGDLFERIGLPPEVTTFEGADQWASFTNKGNAAEGEMVLKFEAPAASRSLMFEVVGAPSPHGKSIIVSTKNPNFKQEITFLRRPENSWVSRYVDLPDRVPFSVTLKDHFDSRWFGIREIRECGHLMKGTRDLLGGSLQILGAGAVLLEGLLFLLVFRAKRES